jgi:hypothetical protein
MAIVIVSKSISWDFDVCTLKTYRVEGTYRSANPGPLQDYITNITACSVDEVCEKLTNRGFVRNIRSIQVFDNAPLFGPLIDDPTHLLDVTPSSTSCQECCDFLVTEDHFQSIKVNVKALLTFASSGSGNIRIYGSGNVSTTTYYKLHTASGKITIYGNSSYEQEGHSYASASGIIKISNGTSCVWHASHAMSGKVTLIGLSGIGFYASGSGNIVLSGSMNASLSIFSTMSGVVHLTSDFDIISSSYYHSASGNMHITSDSLITTNDLGTVSFVAKVITEIVDLEAEFSSTPADEIVPDLTETVALPACCSVAIPTSLGIKHNLDGMLSLSRFLLRNGLSLPGTGVITLPMQYRPRFNSWQSNLHYSGRSAEYNGNETWDIVFELSCLNNSGVTRLSSNAWQFMMLIHRKEDAGQDFMARFLTLFDIETFCPLGKRFDGFNFKFNIQNRISTPIPKSTAIFHDEARLFNSSPVFINKPELAFQISVADAGDAITSNFSLEVQRKATVEVGI